MSNIDYNELIKTARKQKGLTQQELADQAGLSLRTVQRIEKGKQEVSGFSLKQISIILDLSLEQLIMPNINQISIDINQIGSVKDLYLSSLCFLINPTLGVVVPAIVGFSKQNKTRFYRKHLMRILLIQGGLLVLIGGLFLLLFFFKLLHYSVPSPLNLLFSTQYILILPFLYYGTVLALIFYNYLKLKE